MSPLPTGTVTFLFTDVEGSTRLLQRLGDTHGAEIFEKHRRLLREAFAIGGGRELQDQGDGFLVAFQSAHNALATAVAIQRAVNGHPWPEPIRLRVRIGLHTGEPVSTPHGYVGVDVQRAAKICAIGHGGQVLLSRSTRGLVENGALAGIGFRDLGWHRLKELESPEQLFQLLHPDLPAEFPPLASLDRYPNNFPRQLTSFVGREREIGEITEQLAATPLLTLTGAGGSGKTRLALHVAAALLDEFKDGVWFVELGRLSEPALLPQSVASVLGVREEYGGRPLLDTLADFLRRRSLLLMLDNCEHLLEPSAAVATTLLRAAPGLRILATSRERLGITGEVVYYVPSLSVPDPQAPALAGQAARYEALRLFEERAASRQPGFRVTDRNVQAVTEICRRLDGMPLAIELAAARVQVLTVEQIAARIDDRFQLLTGGDRTALPQHRTLRAVMDWSYHLLSEAAQTLLRRLAVFAGGFTLDATEEVCTGDGLRRPEVLDILSQLVERSLVVVSYGPESRYGLLETVREYAREKLIEADEMPALRTRHRDWCLALAEQAEPEVLTGPNQREWLERIGVEDPNLRAALEWSHTGEQGTEAMLRIAGALVWYWFTRAHWNEAREWLKRALSRPDSAAYPARAKALYGLAFVLWLLGDTTQAIELASDSLALCREYKDKWGMACSIFVLGVVATERGETDRATALLEEGLELYRTLGHPQGIGMTQFYLGHAVSGSNHRRATALWENSLALLRKAGDKRGLAVQLGTLGDVAWLHGDYRQATKLYRECEALGRELAYTERIAYALFGLGGVSRTQGDYDKARALIEESLGIYRQFTWKTGIGLCLRRLGLVALERGDLVHARERLDEALALFRELDQKSSIGDTMDALGTLARHGGDLDRAVVLSEQALALFCTAKDRLGIAASMLNLGKIAQRRGDLSEAARLFRESLAIRREFDYTLGIAESLEALGTVAADSHNWAEAAHLLGCAQALREALGAPIPVVDRSDHDRYVADVHAALGETADAKWMEGRTMDLHRAVGSVLAQTR